MITIAFHGAAQTVTGSKYLLRAGKEMLLIDSGVFQGLKELRLRNWDSPPFNAHHLRWIVLTHAHTDHIGFLPRLYRCGFRGKVLCSAPTARLARILLYDAAHIHEEDARYLNKTKATRHEPALPLFTIDDVKEVLRLFKSVPVNKTIELTPHVSFELRLVGHILGACSVLVRMSDGDRTKSVLFSGDIGRYNMPLIPDPEPPRPCDYLVMESTYGDRRHKDVDPWTTLAGIVRRVVETGGVLLIPAFAVGRAQQIVHMLIDLAERGEIPQLPIHVDSPMAEDVTAIFCEFPGLHRIDLSEGDGDACRLYGPNVEYHRTKKSSQKINSLDGPRVIISASGMLTGGRILHHLTHRLGDPRNIVAMAGFQAVGTRGRDLLEGKKVLRFHGRNHDVRAEVTSLGGLSGHADYAEIMQWLTGVDKRPERVFVTHGEPEPSRAMAERVEKQHQFETVLPELGDEFEL
jgi:metallo-beta-lactamase family protein